MGWYRHQQAVFPRYWILVYYLLTPTRDRYLAAFNRLPTVANRCQICWYPQPYRYIDHRTYYHSTLTMSMCVGCIPISRLTFQPPPPTPLTHPRYSLCSATSSTERIVCITLTLSDASRACLVRASCVSHTCVLHAGDRDSCTRATQSLPL